MIFGRKSLFSILVLGVTFLGAKAPAWSQARFVFTANFSSNNVSVYSVNTTTGVLTPVPFSPFSVAPAGNGPASVTLANVFPANLFLYVANFNSNNISAFSVNTTTGVLTAVPGSPFAAGTNPQSVAVDPAGQFLYVANTGSNNVSAFVINAIDGSLTPATGPAPGPPFAAGTAPVSVTVDPSSTFVFVANLFSNNVSMYTIDFATGGLIPVIGSPFAAGTGPASAAVDPSSQFVYVGNCFSNNVSGYTLSFLTNSLTPAPGSPFPAVNGADSVAAESSGQFVYVANAGANNVSAYTIDATPGSLTFGALMSNIAGSPFAAGKVPASVTVLSIPLGNQFVYVANASDNSVSGYFLNPNGTLTPVSLPTPTGTFPASVAAGP